MIKRRYTLRSEAEREVENKNEEYFSIDYFNVATAEKNPEVAAVMKAIDKYAKKTKAPFKGDIVEVLYNINQASGTWLCEQYEDGLSVRVKIDRDAKEIKAYASETLINRRKLSENYDYIDDLGKEFVRLVTEKF
jgi:hypothetical protein